MILRFRGIFVGAVSAATCSVSESCLGGGAGCCGAPAIVSIAIT